MAFRIAGNAAVRSTILQADPIVLEPWMNVEVLAPDLYQVH